MLKRAENRSRLFFFHLTRMRATAVIVAAGRGNRLGAPVSKPYVLIAGRPLILRTFERFATTETITDVVLVVAPEEIEQCDVLVRSEAKASSLRWTLQAGGLSRQESVSRGLEKVPLECDVVVIHDGARPFASPALIDRCAREACEKGAVIAGLPARDTIKRVSESREVQSTLERGALWEIQTPQAFRREIIVRAHRWAAENGFYGTDDATLVERLGETVYVSDGERTNIKITVPEDLVLSEALIREGLVDC